MTNHFLFCFLLCLFVFTLTDTQCEEVFLLCLFVFTLTATQCKKVFLLYLFVLTLTVTQCTFGPTWLISGSFLKDYPPLVSFLAEVLKLLLCVQQEKSRKIGLSSLDDIFLPEHAWFSCAALSVKRAIVSACLRLDWLIFYCKIVTS